MHKTKILNKAKVCVKVERSGDRRQYLYRIIEEGKINILPAGTEVVPLNEAIPKATIVAMDGITVDPAGRFYITAGTIDPYHCIIDVQDENEIQGGQTK